MVSNSKLVLEEEGAAAAAQFSLANHSLPVGEYVRLVHKVGRQQYDFAVSSGLQERPHLPSRVRIHTGCRLVENYNFRITDYGYANRQFSLLATAQILGESVRLLQQVYVLQCLFHLFIRGHMRVALFIKINSHPIIISIYTDLVLYGTPRDTAYGGKELEVFPRR